MKKEEYDVTVSVWNEFHAPELCEGLARAGLRVQALRSTIRRPREFSSEVNYDLRARASLLSYGLMGISRRAGEYAPLVAEASQDAFERFAKRHATGSSVFWGWNGHNLAPFQVAKRTGAIIVSERGSTHAAWAERRLNAVHEKLGWKPENRQQDRRNLKALKEYDLADWISIPSQFVKRTFLEEGVAPERLILNPYGVDAERWGRVEGTERETGPLVFIYTAALSVRKGIHILLRAWEKAGLRDAELWLCGAVHLPIRQLGLPVSENVRILGFQQHGAVATIYNRASVYVLPSFEEGLARSGLEALAAGLPLIITEETGLTDAMTPGRHGWVIPSGEVDSLVEVLRDAASDRNRLREMSRDCRQAGLEFTKAAYGERAAAFAKSLLPHRQAAARHNPQGV